jgi:hypothetical protein
MDERESDKYEEVSLEKKYERKYGEMEIRI